MFRHAKPALWIVYAIAMGGLTANACAQLTQADMANMEKLVQQHQLADKNMQRDATNWLNRANKAAREKRWDLAAKMYGEAVIRYPTFTALSQRGLATAHSNRQRDTLPETLVAYQAAFTDAAQTLQLALAFSDKVPGQAKPHEQQALRAKMECLASYQAGAAAGCIPVAQVLKRYAGKR